MNSDAKVNLKIDTRPYSMFYNKSHSMHEKSNPILNTPDVHGFVMVGIETLFVYHLPMFFMQDHRYQLILQVSLPDYAMKQYIYDRQHHPNEVYIFNNVPEDLMTLPQISNGQLTSFIADISRGAPGPDGPNPAFIHNVRATIERVVYFRPFDDNLNYPNYLSYILFGAGNEAHMAHFLTKYPDFDQVLDLAEVPSWLPPQQLEAGVPINLPGFPNCHEDKQPYCSNPLTEGIYKVQYEGQEPIYEISIGNCYWFDTAGINMPHDPCNH